MSWLAAHADDDCCDIIHTGRRSGLPRSTELWFGVIDKTMYLISGNGVGADWYQNMIHEPVVDVVLSGRTIRGLARPVEDVDERRQVGDLMGAKYVWDGDASIGLTYEAWCYQTPALAIDF